MVVDFAGGDTSGLLADVAPSGESAAPESAGHDRDPGRHPAQRQARQGTHRRDGPHRPGSIQRSVHASVCGPQRTKSLMCELFVKWYEIDLIPWDSIVLPPLLPVAHPSFLFFKYFCLRVRQLHQIPEASENCKDENKFVCFVIKWWDISWIERFEQPMITLLLFWCAALHCSA